MQHLYNDEEELQMESVEISYTYTNEEFSHNLYEQFFE